MKKTVPYKYVIMKLVMIESVAFVLRNVLMNNTNYLVTGFKSKGRAKCGITKIVAGASGRKQFLCARCRFGCAFCFLANSKNKHTGSYTCLL